MENFTGHLSTAKQNEQRLGDGTGDASLKRA
jgi:hypothetical protein